MVSTLVNKEVTKVFSGQTEIKTGFSTIFIPFTKECRGMGKVKRTTTQELWMHTLI
jgi:hypothetical protein